MLCLMLIGAVVICHAQSVSDEGLVIYYNFNEDTQKGDDVVDVSGNENDGFLHNLKHQD